MSGKSVSFKNVRAVRNLFFSKLYRAFFLVVLFAGAAFAQGTEQSVMIYTYGKPGTDAEAASHYLSRQIGIGLEQYSCIDRFDDASLAGLLGWERWKELLGQEPNVEAMQNIAGISRLKKPILLFAFEEK